MFELIFQKYKKWDMADFFLWWNSTNCRQTQHFRYMVKSITLNGYEEAIDLDATEKYGQVVFKKI